MVKGLESDNYEVRDTTKDFLEEEEIIALGACEFIKKQKFDPCKIITHFFDAQMYKISFPKNNIITLVYSQ